MYSPLIPSAQRTHLLAPDNPPPVIRSTVNIELLSEFPLLLSGQIKLQIPVYTVWGACEDVLVLEKFRAGTYSIENLNVIDEATTRCLDIGGVKLRLLGLGGALVPHKLFDNGDGNATIAGAQGTMWTTALQIGELVDTAQRVFDQTETRLLVTHASPGREGILAQLALVLKADLTISAGLHFRYATSYNEFSVQGDFEGFRHKLALGKESFDKVWDSVKTQVDAVIDDNQRILLDKALHVVEKLPPAQPSSGPGATATGEEPAWKNCWNWNLCDAAYGSLVLDVKEGRISSELKSQGEFMLPPTILATEVSKVSTTLIAGPLPCQEPRIQPHPLFQRPKATMPSLVSRRQRYLRLFLIVLFPTIPASLLHPPRRQMWILGAVQVRQRLTVPPALKRRTRRRPRGKKRKKERIKRGLIVQETAPALPMAHRQRRRLHCQNLQRLVLLMLADLTQMM